MAGTGMGLPQSQGQEVQLPMIQLPLSGVNIAVGRDPDGNKVLVVGPVVLQIILPLGGPAARHIAGELLGGIEVPTMAIPKGR
jgi:hypothetical protein